MCVWGSRNDLISKAPQGKRCNRLRPGVTAQHRSPGQGCVFSPCVTPCFQKQPEDVLTRGLLLAPPPLSTRNKMKLRKQPSCVCRTTALASGVPCPLLPSGWWEKSTSTQPTFSVPRALQRCKIRKTTVPAFKGPDDVGRTL